MAFLGRRTDSPSQRCAEKRALTLGRTKCTLNVLEKENGTENSPLKETGKFVCTGAMMGFFPAVKASAASLDSTSFRHESRARGLMGKSGGMQSLESDSVCANLFLYPLQGHFFFFFVNQFRK